MPRKSGNSSATPLLTVSQVAVLLGCDRSTLYRAIAGDRIPLPVVRLNRRILVPRVAVERLLGRGEGYRTADEPPALGRYCPTCGAAPPSTVVASRTRATCSAARRSSVAMPSV